MSYTENHHLIEIALKSGLPPTAKRVLMSVISFTERGEWLCKVPRDRILSRVGVSDKPGRKAFAVLAELGLVSPPIACNVPMRQIHRGKIAQLKESDPIPEGERPDPMRACQDDALALVGKVLRSSLKPGARVVLCALLNLSKRRREEWVCVAALPLIAKACSLSISGTRRLLRDLEEHGLVETTSFSRSALRMVVVERVRALGDGLKGEPLFVAQEDTEEQELAEVIEGPWR